MSLNDKIAESVNENTRNLDVTLSATKKNNLFTHVYLSTKDNNIVSVRVNTKSNGFNLKQDLIETIPKTYQPLNSEHFYISTTFRKTSMSFEFICFDVPHTVSLNYEFVLDKNEETRKFAKLVSCQPLSPFQSASKPLPFPSELLQNFLDVLIKHLPLLEKEPFNIKQYKV